MKSFETWHGTCLVHPRSSGHSSRAWPRTAAYACFSGCSPSCLIPRARAAALVNGRMPSAAETSLVLQLLPSFIEGFSQLHQAHQLTLSADRQDRQRLLHAGSKKKDAPDDEMSLPPDFALVAQLLQTPLEWLRRCIPLASLACQLGKRGAERGDAGESGAHIMQSGGSSEAHRGRAGKQRGKQAVSPAMPKAGDGAAAVSAELVPTVLVAHPTCSS